MEQEAGTPPPAAWGPCPAAQALLTVSGSRWHLPDLSGEEPGLRRPKGLTSESQLSEQLSVPWAVMGKKKQGQEKSAGSQEASTSGPTGGRGEASSVPAWLGGGTEDPLQCFHPHA